MCIWQSKQPYFNTNALQLSAAIPEAPLITFIDYKVVEGATVKRTPPLTATEFSGTQILGMWICLGTYLPMWTELCCLLRLEILLAGVLIGPDTLAKQRSKPILRSEEAKHGHDQNWYGTLKRCLQLSLPLLIGEQIFIMMLLVSC